MDFVHSFVSEFNSPPESSNMRHTSCLTCKKRRKKCDRKRPQCDNCTRLNLVCQQSDLFRSSKLSRSHTKRSSRGHSEPRNSGDSSCVPSPERDYGPSIQRNADTGLAPITPATPFCRSEEYLMNHFIESLSPILINIDEPINRLRSLTIPRMVTSPMLTHAVYATSARHLFICEGKAEYRIASLKYCNKAASALRNLMTGMGSSASVVQKETLLLTSVFLCKYEIISGEAANWRPHLRGLYKMFRMYRKNTVGISEEIISYIQSFVSYHWYISGITQVEGLSLSEVTDSHECMGIRLALSDYIDPYMGFSGKFISVLSSLAQIIMIDLTRRFDIDVIMHTAMKAIQIITPPSATVPEMSPWLGHIASAYRHAVVVYLHVALEKLIKSHGDDQQTLHLLHMRGLLPCTKEWAMSACLEEILHMPEHTSAAIGSTPLLFIIATETNDLGEFQIALDLLTRLWKRSCLGNIGVALEFLHQLQQANFPDWRQLLKLGEWDLIIN